MARFTFGRRSAAPIFVIIAALTMLSVPVESQTPGRGRGGRRAPDGPRPEIPTEPKAPPSVKEGQVWIPPMPAMESVAPAPGWVTSGPDVPPMPLTLLRLPRTNIWRAKYPGDRLPRPRPRPDLEGRLRRPDRADGHDRHGRHRQPQWRHRRELDAVLEGWRALQGSCRELHHVQRRGHQRAGLVAAVRRGNGAGVQGGRPGHEGVQGSSDRARRTLTARSSRPTTRASTRSGRWPRSTTGP